MAQQERLARSVGGRGGHEGPEVQSGPSSSLSLRYPITRAAATAGAMDAAVPVDANSRVHRDLQNRSDRGFAQRPQPSSSRERKRPDTHETLPGISTPVQIYALSSERRHPRTLGRYSGRTTRPYAVVRRTRRRGGAVRGAAGPTGWGRRRAGAACACCARYSTSWSPASISSCSWMML